MEIYLCSSLGVEFLSVPCTASQPLGLNVRSMKVRNPLLGAQVVRKTRLLRPNQSKYWRSLERAMGCPRACSAAYVQFGVCTHEKV